METGDRNLLEVWGKGIGFEWIMREQIVFVDSVAWRVAAHGVTKSQI